MHAQVRTLGDAKPLSLEFKKEQPVRCIQAECLERWTRDAAYEGQKGRWAANGNEPALVLMATTSKSTRATAVLLNPNVSLAKQGVTNNSTLYLVSNKVGGVGARCWGKQRNPQRRLRRSLTKRGRLRMRISVNVGWRG